MDDTVKRLHRCLVDALRARGDSALDRPVTVAEIYQDLVPYRTVRTAIGVELNADYEHALLKLLAGVGDLVRIEPSSVRDDLRKELESPDPYVGVYRNFAACDVWISAGESDPAEDSASATAPAAGSPEAASYASPSPSADTPAPPAAPAPSTVAPSAPAAAKAPLAASAPATAPMARGEPADPRERGRGAVTGDGAARGGGAAAARPGMVARPRPGGAAAAVEGAGPAARAPAARSPQPGVASTDRAATGSARAGVSPSGCAFCGQGLPSGRAVSFCPHCGGDQRLRPCPQCKEPLERGWRYCIRCGTGVASAQAPAGG